MPAANLRGGLLSLSLRDGKLRLRSAKPLPEVSGEHEAGPGKEGVPDSTQVDKADVGEGWTVRAAEIPQASREAGGAGAFGETAWLHLHRSFILRQVPCFLGKHGLCSTSWLVLSVLLATNCDFCGPRDKHR